MRTLTAIMALCLLLHLPSCAQRTAVPVIRLNHLEQRLSEGGDTTFVVNLWATWCGPCVKELPYFEALDPGRAKVLLISLDFEDVLETKVIPFVEKRGLGSEVMLLNEDDPNTWIPRISGDWSGAIPATLFVNTLRGVRHFHEGQFEQGELESKLTGLGL